MNNLTGYPYPAYVSNIIAAGVLASLIGISLIAWIVQSIQSHFNSRRLVVLLLVSHLSIFTELVLRASLSTDISNSKAVFTSITVLFATGRRMIILANYDFLVRVADPKSHISRAILIGSILCIVVSAILLAIAGAFAYSTDTIDLSFQLRQASAGIALCVTIVFYPIWLATKTAKNMTKKAITLLIISSLTCLVVAVFMMITSVPDYYVDVNQQEFWFYIFQFLPIAIAQVTWNILHPKRSLVLTYQREEDISQNIDNGLQRWASQVIV